MNNALKVEYCFRLASRANDVSKQEVEDFIVRCLRFYREAERPERSASSTNTETQPSDEFGILAAMCMIRFSDVWASDDPGRARDISLIRAASILERLLLDSPHNYLALLTLVRVYLLLGAGSLALKAFSKLSVKQFQYETVAHYLFTRLATIHPHSAPPIEGAEFKDFDPQSALMQALKFYQNSDNTTVRHRTNGLEYGSYVNVAETIDMGKALKKSVCRRLFALEARQILRLVGADPINRYEQIGK